uniref:Uncharacterized protein n=1 Tax=Tanacetum cinerariifolium TaxID=118510 RepID=A0A699JEM1_TANCI|nr:hypothetical protein [Tanacetum cinerariifolium]
MRRRLNKRGKQLPKMNNHLHILPLLELARNCGVCNHRERVSKRKKDSVFIDLASKITNIDRKMICEDGKPLRAVRRVVFQDPITVVEILNDMSTDVDISEDMRSDCNNDGSSSEAANIDKNAASERGSWIIRKSHIILNKWSSSVSLKKGEVTKVLVWVKLHNVSVLAYSEDGLSLIASQIGKHIMLDVFTSSLCVDSYGRISFSRALIEINADFTLKKKVIMDIPENERDRYIKEIIRVEYEWKPPHCIECKSFSHGPNACPKRIKKDVSNVTNVTVKKSSNTENHEEGFVEVKNRKNRGKKVDVSRSTTGIRLDWQQKKSGVLTGALMLHLLEDASGHNVLNTEISVPIGNGSSKVDDDKVEDDDLDCYDRYEA